MGEVTATHVSRAVIVQLVHSILSIMPAVPNAIITLIVVEAPTLQLWCKVLPIAKLRHV